MRQAHLPQTLYLLLLLVLAASADVHHEDELTDQFAMELHPHADPQKIAEEHGHQKRFETEHGVTHPHHDDNPHVMWSQQQVRRLRAKRGVVPKQFQDPRLKDQWHLRGKDTHVNVEPAWAAGITGQNVTIGVVDDGIQYDHPDLQANYRAESSYDFNYNDNNPYPDAATDDHGTSAAGVAAAGANNYCGVGAAYRAGLAALRLISVSSTDEQEARAIDYMSNDNHIYTNSWGPTDDGRRKEGPGKLATASLENGIKKGRNGKGSIYCWAGGNGRGSKDNCNYDGWANSRYTITIAATDYNGKQAPYSEPCSMLLASAPSSGAGRHITTTDLTECTSTFGGTSAAAPLAAGVMALVLEVNPNLTWRDMQAVLISSTTHNDPNDGEWRTNGAGFAYNHKYGFGLLDAWAATQKAKSWVNLGPEISFSKALEGAKVVESGREVEVFIMMEEGLILEHTRSQLWINCAKRGELIIQLTSPMGTVSNLAEQHWDQGANYEGWDYGSIANWGEDSRGKYVLRIKNTGGSQATITKWNLIVFGHQL
ncbi:peptidase [Planoprotostelium fungivorum]|uniref:Peptidase n=1 Tax=Planoprotostelium fungivorum TaxID=1890364 RepID=A0A2P6NV32_9EUKA|nr:peptidase [Planoprotostelium fungivorum]